MKYFSLHTAKEVHPATGKKVIPASEFSELLSAKEIMEKVKADKKKITQKARKKGYDAGFAEGLENLNAHIIHLNNEVKQIKHELQQSVIPLAMQAAKKIVAGELKTSPETIVTIVMQAVKPIAASHHIKIFVNKDDLELLEKEKPKIKEILEHVDFFAIEERGDIERGGCIIETEKGIINATLENQWRALEAAFEKFMKQ